MWDVSGVVGLFRVVLGRIEGGWSRVEVGWSKSEVGWSIIVAKSTND